MEIPKNVLITFLMILVPACFGTFFIGYRMGHDQEAVPVANRPQIEEENSTIRPKTSKTRRLAQVETKKSSHKKQSNTSPARFEFETDSSLSDAPLDTLSADLVLSPVEQLFSALDYDDTDLQKAELDKAAKLLSLEDIELAMEQLGKLPPGPAQRGLLGSIINRWAQLEPLDAMTYAMAETQPKLRHNLKMDVLRGWAEAEPMQAMKYVELNPNNDLPSGAMQEIFNGVKNGPIENALVFLENIDQKKHGYRVMDVVYDLFEKNPSDIIAWTENLPEGKLRDQALHRTIDHWARYDPLAAKEWMEENTEDHNRLPNQIELAESWARVDPQSAVDWYGELPEDQQSPQIIDRIFRRWVQYEPETAGEWLAQSESSPKLDGPISYYANSLKRKNPVMAMEWADNIHNDKTRYRQISDIGYSWAQTNPREAMKFFETSDLPDSMRERLLSTAKRYYDRSRLNFSRDTRVN